LIVLALYDPLQDGESLSKLHVYWLKPHFQQPTRVPTTSSNLAWLLAMRQHLVVANSGLICPAQNLYGWDSPTLPCLMTPGGISWLDGALILFLSIFPKATCNLLAHWKASPTDHD
jgi:hypothetical protein